MPDLHPDIVRAIRRVGGSRVGRRYDRFARRRYGVSGNVLAAKEVQGESGGRHNAVSSAGARGETQFIPSTRAYILQKYGVDAYAGPRQAVKAMELYQLEGGRGVEGYNPGMPTYRDYILNQKLGRATRQALRQGSAPGSMTVTGPTSHEVSLQSRTIPGQSFAAERQQVRDQLFLTGKPLSVQALLDYKQQVNSLQDVPARRVTGDIVVRKSGGEKYRIGATKGDQAGPESKGRVIVAPGANRAGVNLHPETRALVSHLSAIAGHPVTIGTGTNHNQFVVGTNRESDHWTGRAADIPASGDHLTKLGRQALIAFGMSPRQARRATGGIYNLTYQGHRVQVIFNTTEGGDHFNHLHVGWR